MSVEEPRVETDGRTTREHPQTYSAWQQAVAQAEDLAAAGYPIGPVARQAQALREKLGGNQAEPWWYEP